MIRTWAGMSVSIQGWEATLVLGKLMQKMHVGEQIVVGRVTRTMGDTGTNLFRRTCPLSKWEGTDWVGWGRKSTDGKRKAPTRILLGSLT